MAHAATEITVGGGNSLHPGCHDAHVSAEARAAGRSADSSTGINKCLHIAGLHGIKIHLLGTRDNDAAHIRMYGMACQDFCCLLQILKASIGAGADYHLVNLNLPNL